MDEVTKIFIGIIVLLFGFLIGNWLAKITKEEILSGQKWFKIIILLSIIGVLIAFILRNDILLFNFAFIAIVTSRSLNYKKLKRKNIKNNFTFFEFFKNYFFFFFFVFFFVFLDFFLAMAKDLFFI